MSAVSGFNEKSTENRASLTDLTVSMRISDTFILIDVHINVRKRHCNISLSLIYHAAQSIMGRISGHCIQIHQQ